ncbi:MAG: dUTP diphosphatase [Leptospirales bacterium]
MSDLVQVKFELLREGFSLPEKKTVGAGAYDIRAALDSEIELKPGQRKAIATGLRVEIPQGFILSVRPRSGLAIKEGLTMVNSPGTIDSDFRGEIQILTINLGDKLVTIKPHDRIAQLVLEKTYEIEWVETTLGQTERGEGGFGSTGKH